jgi:hypothetical protein
MNRFNVRPFGHTASSKKYEASSRFREPEPRLKAEVPHLRNFTIIGIPAAVVISGLTAGLVVGLR